jgi:hypothetical protein
MMCEEYGCLLDGLVECHLLTFDKGFVHAEEINFNYCQYHAYLNGFCSCCGDFWGGIESFEFENPSHLCENCLDQIKNESEESEYDTIELFDENWFEEF